MMRAALYLRVSTDERAVSIEAQEDGGRAWCERHGHAVVQVYRDEGVSGAEWTHRPGVASLRADASERQRPFDLVVVRDLDRLGRDGIRLPELLAFLRDRGIGVVEWSTGQAVALDGIALLVAQLRSGLAQIEREQIAHRTRTALHQRAQRGQVTGGVVYGYRNVRAEGGVRYEPHPDEAQVVRGIYERHAAGDSARVIARSLTARAVPAPRGAPSWAPSTVRAILRSERYRGEATWGRVGAEYRDGSRRTIRREDVVRYPVPAIVDANLWQRAQARSVPAREARGITAQQSREPHYLLVGGFVLCDHCGGPFCSWRTTSGSGPVANRRVVQTYRCGWHVRRGPEACAAAFTRPMPPVDRAVVDAYAGALQPSEVRVAVERTRERLRADVRDDRRADVDARVRELDRQVRRLTTAVTMGAGDVAEVVTALRAASGELASARAELAALAAPAPVLDLAAERDLVELAGNVRAAMLEGLERAHDGDREAMRRMRALIGLGLAAPLRARWDGQMLHLTGEIRPGALLGWSEGAGAVSGASNTGGECDPNGFWTAPVLAVG